MAEERERVVMRSVPGQSPERVVLPSPGVSPVTAPLDAAPVQESAPVSALEPVLAPDAATDTPPTAEEMDDTPETITVQGHQRRRPDAEERIRRLTAEKYDALRERERLQGEIDALLRLVPREPAAPVSLPHVTPESSARALPPRPREADYESLDAYYAAIDGWDTSRLEAAAERAAAKQRAVYETAERTRQQQTVAERLGARIAQGRTTFPDFDLAIHDPSNVYREDLIPMVQEVAMAQEDGHLLMYHLATHPEDRQGLDERTPAGAKRYLEQLAQALRQPAPASPEPPAPPARVLVPAPITPVRDTPSTTLTVEPRAIAERGGALRDYMKARSRAR